MAALVASLPRISIDWIIFTLIHGTKYRLDQMAADSVLGDGSYNQISSISCTNESYFCTHCLDLKNSPLNWRRLS